MGLSEKEQEDLAYIEKRYFAYDEPVPACGMLIYPVSMRNHDEFLRAVDCLLLNKNDDIKGLKMTSLEYMLSKINDEKDGSLWSYKLSALVTLCFHVAPGVKCHKCGRVIDFQDYSQACQNATTEEEMKAAISCPDCKDSVLVPSLAVDRGEGKQTCLIIDGHRITNDDFKMLKMIILRQNIPTYQDDSDLSKELRKDQAKRSEILSRGKGSASTERRMVCLAVATGFPLEKIYDLTMRKFDKMLSAVNDLIEYKTVRLGIATGMVQLKDGETLPHWVYEKEQDLVNGLVDVEGFSTKFQNSGA